MTKLIRQYYNAFPDNHEFIVVRMMAYNSCMVNGKLDKCSDI